jgi:hypothetical protein
MTMRKIALLVAAAGLSAAMAAVYFRGPSAAPPGQPALVALDPSNFSEFEAAFDAHLDQPRLVMTFSPT